MNAQAIKPTRLHCLPLTTLTHAAAQDPTVSLALYEAVAREFSACERVASFLLAFSRRSQRIGEDPAEFDLPMTRTDIGDFLGLTIETVSRTFSKLKMLDLIALPHANRVKLIDREALESLATGDDTD
jgi:CRP/FNR family transcriptional regulator